MDDQRTNRKGRYRMSRRLKIFLCVLVGFLIYSIYIEYLFAWMHGRL